MDKRMSWEKTKARLTARGSDGKLLSAITGEETDTELREVMVKFAEKCPTNQRQSDCPFCILNGFYYGSLNLMAASMTRMTLLSLFEMEHELRNRYADRIKKVDGQFEANATERAFAEERNRQYVHTRS